MTEDEILHPEDLVEKEKKKDYSRLTQMLSHAMARAGQIFMPRKKQQRLHGWRKVLKARYPAFYLRYKKYDLYCMTTKQHRKWEAVPTWKAIDDDFRLLPHRGGTLDAVVQQLDSHAAYLKRIDATFI